MAKTIKGTLAVDYCKANPKLPDLTLARKMFEENRDLFNSIEKARDYVRYYRGHSSKKTRNMESEHIHRPDRSGLVYDDMGC
jgi:hypothetical protein